MPDFGIMVAMKKTFLSIIVLTGLLVSCNKTTSKPATTYDVVSMQTGYFSSVSGHYRLLDDDFVVLSPFNTPITGRALSVHGSYDDATYDKMKKEFLNDFAYCHALLDRHYQYAYYEDENAKSDDRKPLNNVNVINASYGTETPIKVDDFLYDVLKKSYEFTINSNLKFNMFLGTINSIYERKLNRKTLDMTALDTVLTLTEKALFTEDFDKNEIADAVSKLPTTVEEVQKLLTFDDEKKTVTFHKLEKADKIEISLGGNGKGFATEMIAGKLEKEYPKAGFNINSGTSSIKAIGRRPDDKKWNISYTNPVYQEVLNTPNVQNPYNLAEVSLKHDGEFNLSTSGYYEQYFYVYDGNDVFTRRNHIIDPLTGYSHQFFDQVSVLIDDTGLADMYTTAMMNTDSVEDCVSLFNKLNTIYNEKDASFILCYKSKLEKPSELFRYSMSDLSVTHMKNGKKYPTVQYKNGEKYEGDYSDFDTGSLFDSSNKNYPATILASATHAFNETYVISSDIKDDFSLLDPNTYSEYIPYPDNIVSRIEVYHD